jgi:hypothetical protein
MPIIPNTPGYIRLIQDAAKRREVATEGARLTQSALDQGQPLDDLVGSHERAIANLMLSTDGDTSEIPEWPKPLRDPAFQGLAGCVVKTIEPYTEADPAALLLQMLMVFGNVIGNSPHFEVEATRHGTNINSVLVGNTSKARKGTSYQRIINLFECIDPKWRRQCVRSGLSSGEGLIYRYETQRGKTREYWTNGF